MSLSLAALAGGSVPFSVPFWARTIAVCLCRLLPGASGISSGPQQSDLLHAVT
jgi:hypothetical protein